jgi:ribose-phosphate pyrophosphokinase
MGNGTASINARPTGRMGPLKLFAPHTCADYGARLAAALGIPVAPLEEREFEDGEHKIRPLESVRGADVYVVQQLHSAPGASVHDKLCRALFLLGALRDAGAARLTAVLPYLAYARKDQRSQPRDPVTHRYVAQLLEAVGMDRVLTLDVHNRAAFQNAFRRPSVHLEARSLFVAHFAMAAPAEWVVVAPDGGAIKRAERFAQALGRAQGQEVGLAFMHKWRGGGRMGGGEIVGDVAGRHALIFDDLISTGGTLALCARGLRAAGAVAVQAAATHGVFAQAANTALAGPDLDRIVICDSVPPLRLTDPAVQAKLTILDTAPFVAEAIARLHREDSLMDLTESAAT